VGGHKRQPAFPGSGVEVGVPEPGVSVGVAAAPGAF
jgi:hypothetical protein